MEAPATESSESSPPAREDRVRLMCSYGGHIVPRPHDKSLCYVGGETRLVVSDRNSSLSHLRARLAKILSGERALSSFTLKYQLPSEDLDSLISVTTEEDLENMLDEYDRSRPNRLRLFLFDEVSAGARSTSVAGAGASINSLLGLEDSPAMETNSSFGSTSSSQPPIVEDRSDQSFGYRKQQNSGGGGGGVVLDLASPDSVSSNNSFGGPKTQLLNDPMMIQQPQQHNPRPPAQAAYYQQVYYIPPPQQQHHNYTAGYGYDYSSATAGDSGGWKPRPPEMVYYATAPPMTSHHYQTMTWPTTETINQQTTTSRPL